MQVIRALGARQTLLTKDLLPKQFFSNEAEKATNKAMNMFECLKQKNTINPISVWFTATYGLSTYIYSPGLVKLLPNFLTRVSDTNAQDIFPQID